MLRMNLMFCSLAHFIIISDQIFLTKLLENINSLKTEELIQFFSFLKASIHLFVDQLLLLSSLYKWTVWKHRSPYNLVIPFDILTLLICFQKRTRSIVGTSYFNLEIWRNKQQRLKVLLWGLNFVWKATVWFGLSSTAGASSSLATNKGEQAR